MDEKTENLAVVSFPLTAKFQDSDGKTQYRQIIGLESKSKKKTRIYVTGQEVDKYNELATNVQKYVCRANIDKIFNELSRANAEGRLADLTALTPK
jgi:hypothetical protein